MEAYVAILLRENMLQTEHKREKLTMLNSVFVSVNV